MKLSTTLLLAFALSGLSVYYFVVEKPALHASSLAPAPRVFNLGEGDSVSRLQIESPASKGPLSLRREGSDWMLVSPVHYPAETFLVEGMIHALVFSRRERPFSPKGRADREFGFNQPGVRVSLWTQKDGRKRTLVLAGDSPVGAGVYARWEGEEEIFLVPPAVKASFERTVYSLRRKKLFRIEWDKVNRLSVKLDARKFRIEKKNGKWSWAVPESGGEIPLEKVSDLIYAFQSLYIKEFLDGARYEEKQFGLRPAESVLAAGSGDGHEEKLILGAPARGKDALYAMREKEGLVLLISEKNLRALVELFEVTHQELQSDHTGKTAQGSGADSSGVEALGPEIFGSDARPGDKKSP